jgi:hypothetical protein
MHEDLAIAQCILGCREVAGVCSSRRRRERHWFLRLF